MNLPFGLMINFAVLILKNGLGQPSTIIKTLRFSAFA